ncbi:hypothetical protein AD006_31570 (plasmid) [Pseudonocardia sp. EC080610-09]|uniref:hypothetical protein n=1 Tax=unclassified Pseudonocardia TaxID=2619320 RepID=UPI0007059136|nr:MULTISPECIES: hypothetical protein [unclassified Pseudonocardia]ALL79696.1 hypothetical protein AD006_31570 [Pseudonocardia sp. EC080610-09]ALL85350.1 hypothetical protein AD017_29680 [Pseudonocardia sp. EC080619-01]
MTDHHSTTEDSTGDTGELGRFLPDGRVTLHRCPCATEAAALRPADRRGRIMSDPDWDTHQTVTCPQCGRYGRLDPTDTAHAPVAVLGIAPLPAGCDDCGATRGEPCRQPFCPGQDLLDPAPADDQDACAGGGGVAVPYTARGLLMKLPSTMRIWRYWASRALHPGNADWRRGALRSTAQATVEVWRLRRGLRNGPVEIVSTADVGHVDVAELFDHLAGRVGTAGQHHALFALRIAQGWGDSVAIDLVDAAAVWRRVPS